MLRDAARLQPVEEFDGGARIGAARVRIADIGGEEFKEAIGRALADGGDEGRGAVGEGDELIHRSINPSISGGARSLVACRNLPPAPRASQPSPCAATPMDAPRARRGRR